MKEKKLRKIFLIGVFLVICILIGVFFLNSEKNETIKKVQAATGSVTLDGGTVNEYRVPEDATGRGGLDLPDNQGWFQNDAIIPNLSRNIINTYTSNVNDSANYVGTLSDGSLIFRTDSRSEGITGFPQNIYIFRNSMIKTDSEGVFDNQLYLATGNSNYDLTADFSLSVREFSRDATTLPFLNNNRIKGTYFGNNPDFADNRERYNVFDFNAETMTDFNWEEFNVPDDSYQLGDFSHIQNQNDQRIYATAGGIVLSAATEYEFELFEYDTTTDSAVGTGIRFDIDSYNDIIGGNQNQNVQINFRALRRYGGHYILLVRHLGDHLGDPVVQHIYKLDASSGNQVDRMQVSDSNVTAKLGDVIKGLSDDDATSYYYTDYSNERTRLMRLDPDAFTSTLVKEFPNGTTIQDITKYTNGNGDDEYNIYMTVDSEAVSDPMFSPFLSNSGIAVGILDENLDVKNLRGINATGTLNVNSFEPILNTPNYAIAGSASTDSDFIEGPFNKRAGANIAAFYGTLTLENDYAPGIRFTRNNIMVDLTDTEAAIEASLLDGITVTDTYDFSSENISGAKDEEWLEARINRNPKRINYNAPVGQQFPAIDWAALGFDKTTVGPQEVKYFVADGSLQASSISRWVNKIGGETIVDETDEYALDAQNFHIPLTGIDTAIPDVNTFKELAKTMAWSLTNHEDTDGDQGKGLDEDGTDASKLSGKVTVDADQLKALREAKVAKPYPVDVTYTPENGVEIINRVWVFVTTTNTVPNTGESPEDTNGVVIYADDYSLPYRLRHNHDLQDVLTNGNVRAYNYYSKDRTSDELTPLPDATNNQSNWVIHNLDEIHDPFQNGVGNLPMIVQPDLSYIWRAESDYYHEQDEETRGSLQVTLTGNVLLHVRQVILDENEELVFPTEGYLQLKTLKFNQGTNSFDEDSSQLVNVRVPSQQTSDTPRFEMFGYESDHMLQDDNFKMELVLPEFYEYVGHFLTHRHLEDPNDPLGLDHQDKTATDLFGGEVELTKMWLDMDGEYFITLYIRPTTAGQSPQPYSWDYKHNDLGAINTE